MGIEKEFDEQFPKERNLFGGDPYGTRRASILEFIDNKLTEMADEMIGEEKLPKKDTFYPNDQFTGGHNSHRLHCKEVKDKWI